MSKPGDNPGTPECRPLCRSDDGDWFATFHPEGNRSINNFLAGFACWGVAA